MPGFVVVAAHNRIPKCATIGSSLSLMRTYGVYDWELVLLQTKKRSFLRFSYLVATAAILLLVQGCKLSDELEPNVRKILPLPAAVSSITVYDDKSGDKVARIADEGEITAIMDELQSVQQSFFDDPEPLGQLLRVEMQGSEGQIYYVNDLRETGSVDSGKIYSEATAKDGDVWQLPSGLIRQIRGESSAGDPSDDGGSKTVQPMLSIRTMEDYRSIVVESNAPMKRSAVLEAIDRNGHRSSYGKDKDTKPEYEFIWSDSQRFIIRVQALHPGELARYRLDGIQTASGEEFLAEEQPNQHTAIVGERSERSRLRLIDVAAEEETDTALPDTTMAQLVRVQLNSEAAEGGTATGEQPYLLMYGKDASSLIPLGEGEWQEIAVGHWPDLGKIFGNDYGYDMLFSDRFYADYTYAVRGNRTLYRVDWKKGTATKLYDAPRAVYGITSSPDGSEIALLLTTEEGLSPSADLVIVDSTGKLMKSIPKAAYISHSDGFLFPYPVSYQSADTIVVPFFGSAEFNCGQGVINWKQGQEHVEKSESVLPTATEEALLKQHIGYKGEIMRRQVQPASANQPEGYVALQTDERDIWLIHAGNGTVKWLGKGLLLGWTSDQKLVIWDNGTKEVLLNSF